MGFQLKLSGFVVFLLLTLSFCQANNVTLKIIGSIHCSDCIRHEFSNSQASPGVDVFISCKSKSRETKTQGNSAVNGQGKFNVTLSSLITEDIQSCFAKLQTASSGAPCPLRSAQTASMELLENTTQTAYSKPTIIEFSPTTCQSAFFFCWPLPNLTLPPPLSEALPPVQPPLPPPEDVIPTPAPASEPPFLPQVPSSPPPTPAPAFHSPQNPPKPTIKNPSPLPRPINKPPPPLYSPIPPPTPQSQHPIPHIPLKKHKKPHSTKTPIAPPPLLEAPSSPPPIPKHENPAPPPSPIKSTPPSEKKPGFIPRAPPVPRLPPVPQAPRKYFNAPKSKSKPPHSY